jgi:hypothetical protein
MSEIQKVFEQQSEIDERAWDTFISEYERRNAPPAYDNRWQRIGMSVGLFSAMIVSSIFTVQAFLQVFELAGISFLFSAIGSVAGFLMVDVILFFLTHFVIDLAYKSTALAGNMNPSIVLWIAIGIAAFTFCVSIASNLYFMFIGFGVMERGSDTMRHIGLIVGILLGSAPPIQSIAVGTIIAMMPLQLIVERQAWELSRQRAWFSFRRKHNLDLSIESRLERLSVVSEADSLRQSETVSNSSKQLDYSQSLTQKAAIEYIRDNQSEYETIRKTVLEQNPTANKRDIAEAIAETMTGEARGYMTVIRAYKKLDIEL